MATPSSFNPFSDLLSRSSQTFSPEDPFSGLQAGRTPEEEAFAINRIAARGNAMRQGAADRIRQNFARMGGGPRGAAIKAQTQSALGIGAQTNDALAQDSAAADAARRQRELALASARGQFGLNVESANLQRLGKEIDVARLGESSRQFDVSQDFRASQADLQRQADFQRQGGLLDLQNRQFDFATEQALLDRARLDREARRANRLQDAELARLEEDRQRLIAIQEGGAAGGFRRGGVSGTLARNPISRQFGGI